MKVSIYSKFFFLAVILFYACEESSFFAVESKEERLSRIAMSEEYKIYSEAVRASFFGTTGTDAEAVRAILRKYPNSKWKDVPRSAFEGVAGVEAYAKFHIAIDSTYDILNDKYQCSELSREDIRAVRKLYKAMTETNVTREESIKLLEDYGVSLKEN